MSFFARRKSNSPPNSDALLLDSSSTENDKKSSSSSASSAARRSTPRIRMPLGRLPSSSANRKMEGIGRRSGTPAKKLRLRRLSRNNNNSNKKETRQHNWNNSIETTPNPKSVMVEASTSKFEDDQLWLDLSGESDQAVIDEGKEDAVVVLAGNQSPDPQELQLVNDTTEELEMKNRQIERKDSQIEQQVKELSALNEKMSEIEGGLCEIERERKALTEKVGNLESEKEDLAQQVAARDSEIDSLLKRQRDNTDFTTMQSWEDSGNSHLSEELAQCHAERDHLLEQLENVARDKVEVNHNLSNCERQIKLLEQEKERLTQRSEHGLQSAQTRHRKEITDLHSELEQRNDRVHHLEIKLRQEQAKVDKLSEETTGQAARTQKLEEEIEAVRAELQEKKSMVDALVLEIKAIEEAAAEVESSFNSQMAESNQAHEEDIAQLSKTYKERVQELRQRKEQQDKLVLALELKIQHQEQQLREQGSNFDGRLAALSNFAHSEIGRITEALKEKQQHVVTLDALVQELRAKLKEQETAHNTSLEELMLEHAAKFRKLNEERHNAETALRKERSHVEMKERSIISLEQKLQELELSHAAEINHSKAENLEAIEDLKKKIVDKQIELDSQREQIAGLQEQLESKQSTDTGSVIALRNALASAHQNHELMCSTKEKKHAAEMTRLRATLSGYRGVIAELEEKEAKQTQAIRDLQRRSNETDLKRALFSPIAREPDEDAQAQHEEQIESLQEQLLAKDLEHNREVERQSKEFKVELDSLQANILEKNETISLLKGELKTLSDNKVHENDIVKSALENQKNQLVWQAELVFDEEKDSSMIQHEQDNILEEDTQNNQSDLERKVLEQSLTIGTLKWELEDTLGKLMHATTQLEEAKEKATSQAKLKAVKAECLRLREQLFDRDQKLAHLESNELKLELEKRLLLGKIETDFESIRGTAESELVSKLEKNLRETKAHLSEARQALAMESEGRTQAVLEKSDLELQVDCLNDGLGRARAKEENLADINALLNDKLAEAIRTQQQLRMDKVSDLDAQHQLMASQAQEAAATKAELLAQIDKLKPVCEGAQAEAASKADELQSLKKALLERDETIGSLMHELEFLAENLEQSQARLKEEEGKASLFKVQYDETQQKIEDLKRVAESGSRVSRSSVTQKSTPSSSSSSERVSVPRNADFFGEDLSLSSEEDNLLSEY